MWGIGAFPTVRAHLVHIRRRLGERFSCLVRVRQEPASPSVGPFVNSGCRSWRVRCEAVNPRTESQDMHVSDGAAMCRPMPDSSVPISAPRSWFACRHGQQRRRMTRGGNALAYRPPDARLKFGPTAAHRGRPQPVADRQPERSGTQPATERSLLAGSQRDSRAHYFRGFGGIARDLRVDTHTVQSPAMTARRVEPTSAQFASQPEK